jgi:hypothetical protein
MKRVLLAQLRLIPDPRAVAFDDLLWSVQPVPQKFGHSESEIHIAAIGFPRSYAMKPRNKSRDSKIEIGDKTQNPE